MSPDERIAACQRMIAREARFAVSDIEIRTEGISYTIETVKRLQELLPSWVRLCFVIGSDAVRDIARWYKADELASLITFCSVERPGFALSKDDLADLIDQGFSVEYHVGEACDISSTELRDGLVLDESCDCAELERRFDAASSLLSVSNHDLREMLKERVGERRYRHCLGVMQCATKLASVYGLNIEYARLAGLIHDWDKNYDDEGIRTRVHELGLSIDPMVLEKMPQILHADTAAAALKLDFPEMPDDVVSAVKRHTVGALDMSDLDKVIYCADALEPNRTFGLVDQIRALVGRVDIDYLFIEVYAFWTELLLQRKKTLYPDTVTIWNEYVSAYGKKKNRFHVTTGRRLSDSN